MIMSLFITFEGGEGAGKTTLITQVLERFNSLSYSISHTTRQPRGSESHGQEYFFVTQKEFEQKIEDNELLEWAKVHDNYYGTSKKFVEVTLAKGASLLLDIDVQGAIQIMGTDLEPVSIFIEPPTYEELERRLIERGEDEAGVIQKRLQNARLEMAEKSRYQYTIINDHLEKAVEALCRIFEKEIH